MSLTSAMFKAFFKMGDKIRDRGLRAPENIQRHDNLDYFGDQTEEHLLDVYSPKETEKPLPAILSVHGGGWVYGNKDAYRFYCMNLARYGFTIVNFNYRLAPKSKFPAALEDVNAVFHWVNRNSKRFHIDLANLFVIGDSAGAQIAAQYASILTNAKYARLFGFKLPDLSIKAIGLNCGMYDPLDRLKNHAEKPWAMKILRALMEDYLGRDIYKFEKEMDVASNIASSFPPAFVMCSVNDRFVGHKPAFLDKLIKAGTAYIYQEYGHQDKSIQHVFHLDIRKDEAIKLIEEQVRFFRQYVD